MMGSIELAEHYLAVIKEGLIESENKRYKGYSTALKNLIQPYENLEVLTHRIGYELYQHIGDTESMQRLDGRDKR